MTRKTTVVLVVILAIFAFALWALLPVEGERFGRQGIRLGLDLQGGIHMVYQADLSEVESGKEAEAISGAIAVIKKRVDVLGVTEPVIQKQGEDRILVELPGVSEAEKAKEYIGQTALLEFGELAAEGEEAEWENEYGRWKPATAVIGGKEKS